MLLIALFLIGVSGLMLHYRIHNFMGPDSIHPEIVAFNSTDFLSFLFPLIDVVIVTGLFLSRKTAVYGYLLNGMIVIYGTVFMTHYSIVEITTKYIPWQAWFLKSTLPDIGIAWGDFFIGKALFDLSTKEQYSPESSQGM